MIPNPKRNASQPAEFRRGARGGAPACQNLEQVAVAVLGPSNSGYWETPKYVRHCLDRRRTGRGGWTVSIWKRGAPHEAATVPYRCGSWRCVGGCQDWYRRQEYARIMEALDGVPERSIYFAVLTLDKQSELTTQQQYARVGSVWPKLRKRLARLVDAKIDYIATVEEQRSGTPHLNVLIVCDSPVLEALVKEGERAPQWWKDMARESGWGYMATFERAKDSSAVASYIAKMGVGGIIAGEVTKATQLPWHSPKGHRRIRASRGFLPPRRKNPEWTGCLHFEPKEAVDRYAGALGPQLWAKILDDQAIQDAMRAVEYCRTLFAPMERGSLWRPLPQARRIWDEKNGAWINLHGPWEENAPETTSELPFPLPSPRRRPHTSDPASGVQPRGG